MLLKCDHGLKQSIPIFVSDERRDAAEFGARLAALLRMRDPVAREMLMRNTNSFIALAVVSAYLHW